MYQRYNIYGDGPQERPETIHYTLTLQIFGINILCFRYNFSFKGDILYRFIPSGVTLVHPSG